MSQNESELPESSIPPRPVEKIRTRLVNYDVTEEDVERAIAWARANPFASQDAP